MKFAKHSGTYYLLAALLPISLNFLPDDWINNRVNDQLLSGLLYVPCIALPILGFLGWRLNQTRILFAALGLLGVFFLLSKMDTHNPGLLDRNLALGTSLSLPLGLGLIYSFKEAPLWSQENLLRIVLLSMPAFLLYGLSTVVPSAYSSLTAWSAFNDVFFHLPHAAFIALILFWLLAFFYPETKPRPFLAALSLALIPVFAAMDDSLNPATHRDHNVRVVVLDYMFSCGILLWCLFAMYWQRVYIDELTGIPNRRALDEKFPMLGSSYCLVMVDIDHFKKFNDTYGHDEGDNVLRYVARHLSDGSAGRAYRYGGEEFCLIFEGWGSETGEGQANGIRESLAARPFNIRLPDSIRKKTGARDRGSLKARMVQAKLTVSMGVAKPDKTHGDPHSVIKLADQALYEAKEKGRNCVVRKN